MPPIAILVALADPTRCRLIELLRAGPQPVHVLAAAFRISRPAISRHLRVLKQAGLISETKSGRENRYKLHPGKLAPVQRWLAEVLPTTPPRAPAAQPALTAGTTAPSGSAALASARRKPAAAVERQPEAPAHPLALAAAKPAPAPAVSQMGFDF